MLLLFESLFGISAVVWILIAFAFSIILVVAIVLIHRHNNRIRFVQLEQKIYEHADTVHKQLEYKVFRLQKVIEEMSTHAPLPPTLKTEDVTLDQQSQTGASKADATVPAKLADELESIIFRVNKLNEDVKAAQAHQEAFKKGVHMLLAELTERINSNEKHLNRFINLLDELASEHGLELMDAEENVEEATEKKVIKSITEYSIPEPVHFIVETPVLADNEVVAEPQPDVDEDELQKHEEYNKGATDGSELPATYPDSLIPETETEDVLSDSTTEENTESQSITADNFTADSAETEDTSPVEEEHEGEKTIPSEPETVAETTPVTEHEKDTSIVPSEDMNLETAGETTEPVTVDAAIEVAGNEPDKTAEPILEQVREQKEVTVEETHETLVLKAVETSATVEAISYTGSVEEGVYYFEKPETGGFFNPEDAGSLRSNKSLYKIIVDPVSGDMASCVLLTDNTACTSLAIENMDELLRPVCDIQSLKGTGSRLTLLQKGVLHKQEQGWQIRPDNRLKVLLF